MTDRQLLIDAFIMGVCAGVVAWAVLAPYGWVIQSIGAYLITRVTAVLLMRITT